MGINDLKKAVDSLSDALVEWLTYIRNPLRSCTRLLSTSEEDQSKIKLAINIMTVNFVISLIILTPLYYFVGISFKSLEFHLPAFLLSAVTVLWCAAAFHIGFRIFSIESRFEDTLLIYSICVGCYSPIVIFVSYPAAMQFVIALKDARVHQLGFEGTFSVYMALQDNASPIANLSKTLGGLMVPVSLVPLGLFAEAISKQYAVSRRNVLSSMSFSMGVVAILPGLALSLLYYVLIYIFASDQIPK
jgi:hypothetical protein